MARRFIGIDLDGNSLHIAVLQGEKGHIRLLRTGHLRTDSNDLSTAIAEIAGGTLQGGDRLTAALPGRNGWVRCLAFPFNDRKALTAALPLALSAHLPIPIEECIWSGQAPQPDNTGVRVLTTAVRRDEATAALAPFDAAGLPVQILDLAPFAVAAGMRSLLSGGILAICSENESTVIRLDDFGADSYRLFPHSTAGTVPAALLIVATRLLRGNRSSDDCPLWLAGRLADKTLLTALRNELDNVELVAAKLDGEALPPQELPAIAIALRGTNECNTQSFNFRHGALALRSAWAPVRRRLIVAALLLGCIVLISAGTALVSYAHRSRQAAALQQELTRRYRDLVPGEGNVADPVMQLRSRMRELQQQARPGGSDRTHAPLAVLRELSRLIPTDLRVDVRDLSWNTDEVRIEGTTASFETANRLLRSLLQSPLFSAVQLTDAKTSSIGDSINFRLTLIIDTSAQGGL